MARAGDARAAGDFVRELLIFKFRTIVGIATTTPLIEVLSGEPQPPFRRAVCSRRRNDARALCAPARAAIPIG